MKIKLYHKTSGTWLEDKPFDGDETDPCYTLYVVGMGGAIYEMTETGYNDISEDVELFIDNQEDEIKGYL